MNKTVSVNLNGLLFNIEEMGYERLLRYLNKIKIYFENSTGSDEIINDIEGRIAELFQERLADGRQVITEKDVDEVMGIMGKPEDFASEFDEESQPNYESNYESGNKKLFRDPDDSILGGVCSGIAYYFGVERVVLRLIFALAFVFAGSGLLLYIILWIVMPVAKTTADKLRMKGEPVNVGNIERRFKEDLKKMGKAVEDVAKEAEEKFKKAKAGDKISGFVSDLIEGVGKFIKVVFNVIGKFIGLIFLMLGLGLFFGAITFAFGSGFIFSGGNEIIPLKSLINALFASSWQSNIFYYGLLLLIISPLIALILAGLRLLIFPKLQMKVPSAINGALFITGIVLTSISVMILISDFNSKGKVIEAYALQTVTSDTLNVDMASEQKINLSKKINLGRYEFYYNDDEQFVYGKARINIYQSSAENVQLKVEKTSRGSSKEEALNITDDMNFLVEQNEAQIIFNPHFTLKPDGKWRGQQIHFNLYIPTGKFLTFTPRTKKYLYDIENQDGISSRSVAGHLFQMQDNGLKCLDCEELLE
jgi:phage shock protein PspC (stress-responsive transcriptional regulator)